MAGAVGYQTVCDKDLLYYFRRGDEEAITLLLHQYEPFISKRASAFKISGLETEDLVQEGKIGLCTAVKNYDAVRGASFRTYARQCIMNRLATAVRTAMRQKHSPLNGYVSLNDLKNMEAEDSIRVASAEDVAAWREKMNALRKAAGNFSLLERKVLYLYLSGVSYTEMARKLHVGAKYIDNALQRMKRKLSLKLAG